MLHMNTGERFLMAFSTIMGDRNALSGAEFLTSCPYISKSFTVYMTYLLLRTALLSLKDLSLFLYLFPERNLEKLKGIPEIFQG